MKCHTRAPERKISHLKMGYTLAYKTKGSPKLCLWTFSNCISNLFVGVYKCVLWSQVFVSNFWSIANMNRFQYLNFKNVSPTYCSICILFLRTANSYFPLMFYKFVYSYKLEIMELSKAQSELKVGVRTRAGRSK